MVEVNWSRLVRFLPAVKVGAGAEVLIGEPTNAEIDVGLSVYDQKEVTVTVFEGKSILDPGRPTGRVEKIGKLLSPLSAEEVGTIRGIGLNYHNHAFECGAQLPKVPLLFLKAATALQDPFPAPILIPKCTANHEATDAEAEIGVVIGRDCKDVAVGSALDYILGYTAINDVSSRVAQAEQSQWCFSKGFDTSCPVGPCIVSRKLCPDPTLVTIRGIKNGKVLQDSPVSDMICDIPHLIAYLSSGTTLKAGTLILTGTPAGVGFFQNPKEILKAGDEYRVELSHGIGTLINRVELDL